MSSNLHAHQVRERLARKVRNVFPGCHAEFAEDLDRGIGFWLVDARGRRRSHMVWIGHLHDDIFTRSWLEWAVKSARGPEPGFPRV